MYNLAAATFGSASLLTSPEPVASRNSGIRRPRTRKSRERHLALSDMVQTEVIPRLRLLHPMPAKDPIQSAPTLDTDQIAAFTALVLDRDIAPVFEAFTRLLTEGYSTDELFLGLLAPSSALLGRLWQDDLCDVIELTAGLARLQVLLFTYRAGDAAGLLEDRRWVLLDRHI